MTPSATLNGRPRKQLSDQLDRMDDILDCLADALPAAVADAVRDGARQAIKDAVLELMASPELRARLTFPAAEPAPPPKGTAWSGLKAKLAGARRRASAALRPAARAAVEKCRAAAPALAAVAFALRWVWRLRKPVLLASAVGVIVAAVSYVLPHATSAVISGVGGLCAALAAQGGLWVMATARRVGLIV